MEWGPACPHVIVKFEWPGLEARLYDLTHRALTEPLRFELDAAGSATNAGLGVGPIEDLLGGLPPDGRRLADGPSA